MNVRLPWPFSSVSFCLSLSRASRCSLSRSSFFFVSCAAGGGNFNFRRHRRCSPTSSILFFPSTTSLLFVNNKRSTAIEGFLHPFTVPHYTPYTAAAFPFCPHFGRLMKCSPFCVVVNVREQIPLPLLYLFLFFHFSPELRHVGFFHFSFFLFFFFFFFFCSFSSRPL